LNIVAITIYMSGVCICTYTYIVGYRKMLYFHCTLGKLHQSMYVVGVSASKRNLARRNNRTALGPGDRLRLFSKMRI
jgi:hypothetical protein